jgi:hypothetical protein
MANQHQSQNNARPPVSVSADPPLIGFLNTNWGTSLGPAFSVSLDPQVNVRLDLVTSPRTSYGRSPRTKMDLLTEEFAEWNDDLLGELAR